MDKRAKDKLVRSPRDNGGGQDAQKDLHSRTVSDEAKGKTQERMEREVERDLQVLGVRGWRELVADSKKWKDIVRQAKAHSGLQCQWKMKKKKKKKKIQEKHLLIIKPRCTNFSNLFLEQNCTCFGQVFCPSSGVQHCIHSNRYMSYS